MASGIGYIIACKELKNDILNISHVAMLVSVTAVDLLRTKYAVLMNKTVLLEPNFSAC